MVSLLIFGINALAVKHDHGDRREQREFSSDVDIYLIVERKPHNICSAISGNPALASLQSEAMRTQAEGGTRP
jgi:hypothetical protein